LGKLAWGCLTKLAGKTAREPDTLSLNITANPFQDFQRFWIIPEINTNFFKDRLSRIFNGFGCLIGQHIHGRNMTHKKRRNYSRRITT
jgi:hypothetical protein